jgi:hypothetical protein
MDIALLVFFALTVALNIAVIFDIIYDIVVARCKRKCPPVSASITFGTPRSRE